MTSQQTYRFTVLIAGGSFNINFLCWELLTKESSRWMVLSNVSSLAPNINI